jgi:hypothetical protein
MKRLLEQIDYYETEVKIYVYTQGDFEVDYDTKALLKYRIELEYRSWGIKSLYPVFSEPLEVRYSVLDAEGEPGEEKTVSVDLSNAEVEYYEGSVFSPYEVEVKLDTEGKVLGATVNCSYIKP